MQQPLGPRCGLGLPDMNQPWQGEQHGAETAGIEPEAADGERGRTLSGRERQVVQRVGQQEHIARRQLHGRLLVTPDLHLPHLQQAYVGAAALQRQAFARLERGGIHAVAGQAYLREHLGQQVSVGEAFQLHFRKNGQVFR